MLIRGEIASVSQDWLIEGNAGHFSASICLQEQCREMSSIIVRAFWCQFNGVIVVKFTHRSLMGKFLGTPFQRGRLCDHFPLLWGVSKPMGTSLILARDVSFIFFSRQSPTEGKTPTKYKIITIAIKSIGIFFLTNLHWFWKYGLLRPLLPLIMLFTLLTDGVRSPPLQNFNKFSAFSYFIQHLQIRLPMDSLSSKSTFPQLPR